MAQTENDIGGEAEDAEREPVEGEVRQRADARQGGTRNIGNAVSTARKAAPIVQNDLRDDLKSDRDQCQIVAGQPQGDGAEEKAESRCHHERDQQAQPVGDTIGHRKHGKDIGADSKKRSLRQRNLAGKAEQNRQAKGCGGVGNREDQQRLIIGAGAASREKQRYECENDREGQKFQNLDDHAVFPVGEARCRDGVGD